MARCRIYLCTYRRPKLLDRALKSLLQQTVQDWICELHNDDPEDAAPKLLVDAIADPRITLITHPRNLGATQTFNLVFQKVEEPFVSLLEDDNWWQPNFLETMLNALAQHPHVEMAWSNMRMWQEQNENQWTDLQKSTFPFAIEEPFKLFNWAHSYQMLGALHSQGAMMVRTKHLDRYQVPASTPSAIVEHVRERAYSYPILFVNQELANFAVTRSTSRSKNPAEWGASQHLLATTFLKHLPQNEQTSAWLWETLRNQTPRSTSALLWSGLLNRECRYLLKQATVGDWLMFFLQILKRPIQTYQVFQVAKQLEAVEHFLDFHTEQQFRTSNQLDFEQSQS